METTNYSFVLIIVLTWSFWGFVNLTTIRFSFSAYIWMFYKYFPNCLKLDSTVNAMC